MISRDEVLGNLERYDLKKAKIGVVASHSALDTCDGAISEGFQTVAVCQQGRDATFSKYFKSQRTPTATSSGESWTSPWCWTSSAASSSPRSRTA